MDPSLCSSLFNRMMESLELGDEHTAGRIDYLICNFYPDSPTAISICFPSADETFFPVVPSSSFFVSISPVMTRSSKSSGSGQKASRVPRTSLLGAQVAADSDVDDHRRDRLHFSFDRPCSFDCEVNVVGEGELCTYRSRFGIPDTVVLTLPGERAVWNPSKNTVAIYGAMLSCGVTLPLQPFIARFLAEA